VGVRRSHFLGIALVAGARSLMHGDAHRSAAPLAGDGDSRAAASAAGREALRPEAEIAVLRAEVAQLREKTDRLMRLVARDAQPGNA
jgi:hypothetical protein